MAVVNFEKIRPITMDMASALNGGPAVDATTESTRPHLYDPLWGYFLFGQSVGFLFKEDQTSQDLATFTIQGVFTADAEGVGNANDDTAFAALVSKYAGLETLFANAAKASAPDQYAEYGTALDPRYLQLPEPLVDKDGSPIYAKPLSLRIDRTQFPNEIKYEAILEEAKFPKAKLVVNGFIVDDGEVDIEFAGPVLAVHEIVGTSGTVFQVKNYSATEASIRGSLPLVEPGELVSDDLKALVRGLDGGTLTLSAAVIGEGGIREMPVYQKLDVVNTPVLDLDYAGQVTKLAIDTRE